MYTRTTEWVKLQTIPKTRTFRTEYAKTEKKWTQNASTPEHRKSRINRKKHSYREINWNSKESTVEKPRAHFFLQCSHWILLCNCWLADVGFFCTDSSSLDFNGTREKNSHAVIQGISMKSCLSIGCQIRIQLLYWSHLIASTAHLVAMQNANECARQNVASRENIWMRFAAHRERCVV